MEVGAISAARPRHRAPESLVLRVVALLVRWQRRASSRAALSELPPERLRDIGITVRDAKREAARPFWEG